MDFRLGKKSDEFRAEVRAFIDEQLTDAVMEQRVLHRHDARLGLPPCPGGTWVDRRCVAGGVRGSGS